MSDQFERRVRGAGVAGWWTVLAGAALVTVQWVAYLVVISSRPGVILSLWGATDWSEVQHLWLLATGFLKVVVGIMAMVSLWLTLWARELRRGSNA